jgi:hypothetical protein
MERTKEDCVRLFVTASSLALLSCVTLPAGEGGSSAAYVGDRASMALTEVVVSVPSPAAPGYQNLHVVLGALVNPKKVSLFSPFEVEQIIRRAEPRISAHLLGIILASGSLGAPDLPRLRDRIAIEAQAAFGTLFGTWKHADEYEVRVVVTSLYFTDGSVGRPPESRRFWW